MSKKRGGASKARPKESKPQEVATEKPVRTPLVIRGRPTLLCEEVAEKIILAVANGNTRACSAAFADVTARTFQGWLAQGEADTEAGLVTEHSEFLQRIKKAEGDAEAWSVAKVRAGGPGWQGNAWWLERKKFNEWGRKDSVNLKAQVEAMPAFVVELREVA